MTPDSIRVEPWERVAFVGKTQSGKTHAAGLLLLGVKRLIVIDPKGKLSNLARTTAGKYSWRLSEWDTADGRRTREALWRGEAGRIRFHAPMRKGAYEEVFNWAYRMENVTVYIDEMYSVARGTEPGQWLNAIYTQGAEMGIGVWASSQRPRRVPVIMFSESEWKFVFRLPNREDRKFVAEETSPEVIEPLNTREFYLYNEGWDRAERYPYIVSSRRV